MAAETILSRSFYGLVGAAAEIAAQTKARTAVASAAVASGPSVDCDGGGGGGVGGVSDAAVSPLPKTGGKCGSLAFE